MALEKLIPPPVGSPVSYPLPWPWVTFFVGIFQILSRGRVAIGATPATSSAPGEPGQVSFDSAFLYICVADSSWRRIALTSF